MKYISPLLSDARNKLGGTVFARNRAGLYTRARVAPTQPRTVSQQANRASFASLSSAWKTLTQSQIAGWNSAADATTLTDTLGHDYKPSGLQLYISCNRNLALIGLDSINDPPGQKPAFASVGTLDGDFRVIGGTIDNFGITVPSDLAVANPAAVLRCTPGLSPGVTFVNSSLYRVLAPPFDSYTDGWNIPEQWALLFGYPVPGVNLAYEVRRVDPATGYSGPWTKASAPIQGS